MWMPVEVSCKMGNMVRNAYTVEKQKEEVLATYREVIGGKFRFCFLIRGS